MPAAYSLDLRQKAIASLEAGHSKAAVSQLMGIGKTTLTEWHRFGIAPAARSLLSRAIPLLLMCETFGLGVTLR